MDRWVERRWNRARAWRRPVAPDPVPLADGLVQGGDMAGGDPPQHQKRFCHVLEKLTPPAQEVEVLAAVAKVPQQLARFPHAEVDEDVISERAGGGGV